MELTSFTIKGFPLELYRKFKSKCAGKGWTVKEGILQLMKKFVGEK